MLLPGNRDDREAAKALAMSTGGGLLLGDQGYSGEDTFGWLWKNAQMLRAMPSEEEKEGLSTVSQVRQRIESSCLEVWRRFVDRIYTRLRRGPWTSLVLEMIHSNLEQAGIVTRL
jgi:hypothetical protein